MSDLERQLNAVLDAVKDPRLVKYNVNDLRAGHDWLKANLPAILYLQREKEDPDLKAKTGWGP